MMDRSDFSQQRMAKYLRKQYESMLFEYNERQAAIRVELLLSGAVEALNQTYSPRIDPHRSLSAEQSSNALKSVGTTTEPSKEAPKSQDGFLVSKKLVLRDTPISSNTTTAGPRSEPSKPVTEVRTVSDATLQLPIPSKNESNSSLTAQPLESTGATRSIDYSSAASGGASTTDATTTPRSTGTKTPRVRKIESPAAEENLPSKKSVEIVYRNFGNEFIVAATERKRRFVPKKEPVETEEDRKARERQERYVPTRLDTSLHCSLNCLHRCTGERLPWSDWSNGGRFRRTISRYIRAMSSAGSVLRLIIVGIVRVATSRAAATREIAKTPS